MWYLLPCVKKHQRILRSNIVFKKKTVQNKESQQPKGMLHYNNNWLVVIFFSQYCFADLLSFTKILFFL